MPAERAHCVVTREGVPVPELWVCHALRDRCVHVHLLYLLRRLLLYLLRSCLRRWGTSRGFASSLQPCTEHILVHHCFKLIWIFKRRLLVHWSSCRRWHRHLARTFYLDV